MKDTKLTHSLSTNVKIDIWYKYKKIICKEQYRVFFLKKFYLFSSNCKYNLKSNYTVNNNNMWYLIIKSIIK